MCVCVYRHSVHSVHSQCSEVETLTDLSPNAVLPTFSNMAYTSILSDEIEEVWYSHVHRVMTDTGGTHAIDTFHIFTRLFNVSGEVIVLDLVLPVAYLYDECFMLISLCQLLITSI